MKRKIKPYPAIVPDDIKPVEKDFPSLHWIDYLVIAVQTALCIIIWAGIAGYVWGMVR